MLLQKGNSNEVALCIPPEPDMASGGDGSPASSPSHKDLLPVSNTEVLTPGMAGVGGNGGLVRVTPVQTPAHAPATSVLRVPRRGLHHSPYSLCLGKARERIKIQILA